ncbi:MAG TPA: hypothetical protein VE076_09160, partial [Nitrososphaeraceae archaeon]|nr:hypothetical protein [Nitrososphaeraceae archaeon]
MMAGGGKKGKGGRRTNESVAEILTPITTTSSSSSSTNNEDLELQRKITIATEGFSSSKFCELILRDRKRISKENALAI